MRLFCFPHAGAGASVFVPWGRLVSPEIEVVAVQPPGREARLGEPPFSDALELAKAATLALTPYFDRPFALFGHSAGALIAFEVARHLRRAGGRMPEHLFASGRGAPQIPLGPPHVHALPHDAFIAALREYGGTPDEVLNHPELVELLEPILRADFSLGETYRYPDEPPLDVPISGYYGLRDATVDVADLERWADQTTAGFRMRAFDGDHFFIAGQLPRVVEAVQMELAPAVARARSAAWHG
jgi:surfactin synthase thioesterase subunit